MSTECGPAYHWNVVWSFGTSWVYEMDDAIDDGLTVVTPFDPGRGILFMCGCIASKPVDLVDGADDRSRRYRIAATARETNAIPPTMPPAIAPASRLAFELLPFGGTVDGDPVEDALAEDVYPLELYPLEAPIIAPEPYSGISI
jgi:hypothetical protein